LQGDESPREGRPAQGFANTAAFAEGNAQRAIARREQLGDKVLADFTTAYDLLNQLLASLGPQDWEKPTYYSARGMAPLRLRPANRLFELMLHGWDIRSRLEADAHLSDKSVPALVEAVLGMSFHWLFHPDPRLPVPIRYCFTLTGVGARNTDIVVAGDAASVEPAGTATANVTCRCDTETFVLIMTGRLRPSDALAQGRLEAAGEMERVDAFAQWFKA
jgi:hypothetical protein